MKNRVRRFWLKRHAEYLNFVAQLWDYFESRQIAPNKASVAVLDRFGRGNRVINVSDHRDHLLTRCGGRSKTFSLSFPSIFPPCSSHRTEKGDPPGVHCWRVPVWRATTGTFPGPWMRASLFHEPIFLQIYARSTSKYPRGHVRTISSNLGIVGFRTFFFLWSNIRIPCFTFLFIYLLFLERQIINIYSDFEGVTSVCA